MSQRPGHDIKRGVVQTGSVVINLENGVTIDISSNPGYVYISFSGIDVEKPIEVKNPFANGLSICYQKRPD